MQQENLQIDNLTVQKQITLEKISKTFANTYISTTSSLNVFDMITYTCEYYF